MKRMFSVLAVAAVAALPLVAQASSFASGQDYNLGAQEHVAGNLYVTGGTVTIAADVGGDLAMVGGNLSVNGHVANDVAAVGGSIQVLGPVGDDVRVAGGQITIGDRVGGDLLVTGGMVHILPAAVIEGDLRVVGGQVVVDGTVNGEVHMTGGKLTINGTVRGDVNAHLNGDLMLGSGARLLGSLDYSAPREVQIAPGAKVNGSISYAPGRYMRGNQAGARGMFWGVVGMLTAMKMLAYLGMAVLLVWLWGRRSQSLLQDVANSFWPSVGRGLIYLILVPIGAVLLVMSFVGVIPAILAMLLYVATLILAKALAGLFLGAWLSKMFAKRATLQVTWGNALGGVVLFQLLDFLPIIGWLLQALLVLAVFGVLAHWAQRQLSSR